VKVPGGGENEKSSSKEMLKKAKIIATIPSRWNGMNKLGIENKFQNERIFKRSKISDGE